MLALSLSGAFADAADAGNRPNIVMIVGEDLGAQLGCYGDPAARTPNLDRFAAEGARFTNAFTHCPVCAPSRSGLVTGMYPTAIGSHHMRSTLLNPPETFPSLLKKAGYTVYWPGKTDFNFTPPPGWVTSTENWMRPAAKELPKQPFFLYHNIGLTHESQTRNIQEKFADNTRRLRPEDRQDKSKVPLPPYYPDTPAVRENVANYYELVTALDYQFAEVMKKIEPVKDNTIVIFVGDHGWGLPRGKRWLYDSGIKVPLIVRWPGKVAANSVRGDLVSFVDLAPTILSIAGVEVPQRMHGQRFVGENLPAPRKYVYAHRDRMDETYDRVRAVRDGRYKYVRNFHPELPYAQRVQYMELMPIMKDWRRLNAEGKLEGAQKLFFQPTKPAEELYDTEKDPHEINNLVADPNYNGKLTELRAALDRWLADTKDLGGTPEPELVKQGLVADRLKEYEQRKQ